MEASGVSEPDRIMDIAKLDPELRPNGIVVLVDANEVINNAADSYIGNIVVKQLQKAELLIVPLDSCLRGWSNNFNISRPSQT